jgi:hypothetical protein
MGRFFPIRILTGDGALKLVNFVQAAQTDIGARPYGARADVRGEGLA